MTCCFSCWTKPHVEKTEKSEKSSLGLEIRINPSTGVVQVCGLSQASAYICGPQNKCKKNKTCWTIRAEGVLRIDDQSEPFLIKSTSRDCATTLVPAFLSCDVDCESFSSRVKLESISLHVKCNQLVLPCKVPVESVCLICVGEDPSRIISSLFHKSFPCPILSNYGSILDKINLVGKPHETIAVCHNGNGIILKKEGHYLISGSASFHIGKGCISQLKITSKVESEKIGLVSRTIEKQISGGTVVLPFYANVHVPPLESVCFEPIFTSDQPVELVEVLGSVQFLG